MLIEGAAQHFAELRPVHQRRQRHVRGDEAFAIVMHELQQIGLLSGIDRNFAMPHKEDRVHVSQIRSAAGWLRQSSFFAL